MLWLNEIKHDDFLRVNWSQGPNLFIDLNQADSQELSNHRAYGGEQGNGRTRATVIAFDSDGTLRPLMGRSFYDRSPSR